MKKRRINKVVNEETRVVSIHTWSEIKDEVYGRRGNPRRDQLERDFEALKLGFMLREARKKKMMTQEALGNKISRKRSYISRIENDGSNLTMKTLLEIVEIGLEGKLEIAIII